VLLHVMFSTRCCGCGPEEPVSRCVVLCTVYKFVSDCQIQLTHTNLHTVHKTTHRLLRTTATTPSAEHHMQQYTTCTPEDGHIDARNV